MRLGLRFLVFTCAMCAFVQRTGATELTRVARTLPFGLSPSTWTGSLRSIWQWPRGAAISLFRLVNRPDTRKTIYEFRPEDGARAALEYQRRYGYRGERLIEMIGAGYHPDYLTRQRTQFQPAPPSVLVPPRPSL